MKYFLTFAVCAVVTVVLVHLIVKLLGFDDANDITLWVSVVFLYFVFYGFSNPFMKGQKKE
ncbi:MAG: hypothetical protein MK100_03815 [Phycisphaerales bacterium]|nr:hypothetical protein [Phycisphaerales bacterium]